MVVPVVIPMEMTGKAENKVYQEYPDAVETEEI
jgi:hypothetical protein